MFKCDYHSHTKYSFDGSPDNTVDLHCASAIERGITDLAITDHFECNWRDGSSFPPFDIKSAYADYLEAKEKYKGKLNLTFGVEIGQANQFPEEAAELLTNNKIDFVISSIHNLTGAPDFYYFDFGKMNKDRLRDSYVSNFFERCIDEACDAIDLLQKVDTVGHITYMERYCNMAGLDYDFTKHTDKLEMLFKKMISRDIALEVNTSTLWKGQGFSMPDRKMLSIYRDCGGRLLTVGSDAHYSTTVGLAIEEGFERIKAVGLSDILVVRDGKKTIVKI